MLAAARGTVYARDAQDGADAGYGLETEMAELDGALVEAAQTAAEALDNLLRPLTRLGKRLEAVLERSEEHTSELQSLMRISYDVFCLKKNIMQNTIISDIIIKKTS